MWSYDTDPHSRLRAPAIGSSSSEVVQAQWLVRSFLELLSSGIDRAFVFTSRDSCTGDSTACPNNHIQFATAGVLTQKGDESPKTSWYYLAAFRARLGSMRYRGEVDGGRNDVRVARFYDATANRGAYVVWAPTSDGTVVDHYTLALASGVSSATLVALADGHAMGQESSATITAGNVDLQVSETPTLVLIDGSPD